MFKYEKKDNKTIVYYTSPDSVSDEIQGFCIAQKNSKILNMLEFWACSGGFINDFMSSMIYKSVRDANQIIYAKNFVNAFVMAINSDCKLVLIG